MKIMMRGLGLVCMLLAAEGAVAGHHSTSAIFDDTKRITVTGTMTKVDWVNPHIFVHLESKEGATAGPWKFESSPPAWWKGVGIARADIAKAMGQSVTITASPSRDGSHYAYMRKITFANGDSLEASSGL